MLSVVCSLNPAAECNAQSLSPPRLAHPAAPCARPARHCTAHAFDSCNACVRDTASGTNLTSPTRDDGRRCAHTCALNVDHATCSSKPIAHSSEETARKHNTSGRLQKRHLRDAPITRADVSNNTLTRLCKRCTGLNWCAMQGSPMRCQHNALLEHRPDSELCI